MTPGPAPSTPASTRAASSWLACASTASRRTTVTDVIFTHLHFDHVGWATAKGEVVFRHATYRVHEADWAYFVDSPGALPGAVRKLSPVKPQLETFSSECTLPAPGVDATPAPGHAPARQSTSCPAAVSGPCCSATSPTRQSS